MEIFTLIMLYYLVYYHIGRRLANQFASGFGDAKLFGILAIIIFGLIAGLGSKIIDEQGIKFLYVFLLVAFLTIITIYFHIKNSENDYRK